MPDAPSAGPDPHRHNEYYKQLGMFSAGFAQMESQLFLCLILVSGVNLSIGKAVFSGARARDAVSFIKRIMLVKKMPDDVAELLSICFDQIGLINTIRNHLMHHGINYSSDIMQTSDELRALTEEKTTSFEVSPKLLHNMSMDIAAINDTLSYCSKALNRRRPSEAAATVAQRAWLYKPQPQASKDHKPPPSDPKRKRQPRPSRE